MKNIEKLFLTDGSIIQLSFADDFEFSNEFFDELKNGIENGKFIELVHWQDIQIHWNDKRLFFLNCKLIVGGSF